MNVKRLLKVNLIIASLGLAGLYFLDYPLELVPMLGISWVIISSLSAIERLIWLDFKKRKRGLI